MLAEQLWPGGDAAGEGMLGALMEPLCTLLYDALRPALLQLHNLDALCHLCDILQHEASACSQGCFSYVANLMFIASGPLCGGPDP